MYFVFIRCCESIVYRKGMDDFLGVLKRILLQCKSVEYYLGVSEYCKECGES